MKKEFACVGSRFRREFPNHVYWPFLKNTERPLRVLPQREPLLARECSIKHLYALNVRQCEASKIVGCLTFAPCHEVVPVAVQKAIGMHDLVSALARAAIEVMQLDLTL